jgi:hypothetical protein
MSDSSNCSRRAMLLHVAMGLSLMPLALSKSTEAQAAAMPLLSEKDPAAQAVHYVEDASRATDAQPGANCSNCSIYSATGDTQGGCTLFKDKLVKAAGWCSSWSGL